MTTVEPLVIGVGGVGTRIAAKVGEATQSCLPPGQFKVLGVDTDVHDFGRVSRIRALNISRSEAIEYTLERLPSSNRARKAVEALGFNGLMQMTLAEGSGALFEIGDLAFEAAKGQFLSFLSEEMASISSGKLDLVLVGSLCGGTSAAVLPRIASFVRENNTLSAKIGEISGYALSSSCFISSGVIPTSLVGAMEDNERKSLETIKQTPEAFDGLLVVEPDTNRQNALNSLLEGVADRILSDLARDHSRRPTDWPEQQLVITENEARIAIHAKSLDSTKVNNPRVRSVEILRHAMRTLETVSEFEKLVCNESTPEHSFQKFLETYPEILTGFDYATAHPHVMLEGHDGTLQIPDFMLLPLEGEFADILELKLPKTKLSTKRGRHFKLTSEIEAAFSQLRDYSDFFESERNREAFHQEYGFTSYKPRLSLVVGRSPPQEEELIFRRLISMNRDIDVFTYDDLLRRAKNITRFG